MAQPALGTSAATTRTTASGHIAVIDGQPTTTTQDIADVYGKRHDNVLAIVRARMAEAGEWGVLNFKDTPYTNPQNGQTYTVIRMTKKGFHFVVGKFTGAKAVAHQIAFADEFERMEAELAGRTLGHTPQGEPVFNVTARELDELVEQRVKQHWLGKVALDALPRKRLDAEWDEYNQLLDESGKLALAAERFMQASQQMAAHAVLAGECIGQVATLRARALQRRDGVFAQTPPALPTALAITRGAA